MTDQLSLFGERAAVRPLGGGEGRKPICTHRGAASVVGVGGESSPGAEVSSATALRRTAGYETRTSGGGTGGASPPPTRFQAGVPTPPQ